MTKLSQQRIKNGSQIGCGTAKALGQSKKNEFDFLHFHNFWPSGKTAHI